MKSKHSGNFLELVPSIPEILFWKEEEGKVTLEQENKGLFNFIAQKLFKKPRISYIHLDDLGSFVWLKIDGVRNIGQIGETVAAHLNDNSQDVYSNLASYFKILESYNFVILK